MIEAKQTFDKHHLIADHVSDLVDSAVAQFDGQSAFSCILPSGHHGTITYREFGHFSDAIAAYLSCDLGVKKGDVVALQSPNCLAYPVLVHGALKAGATLSNINPLYTPEEATHQLRDSGAKILFVIDLFGDKVGRSIEGTQVEKVIKISLLDLFPTPKRLMLGFILKYVKKLIPVPDMSFDDDFQSVLNKGLRHLTTGINVKALRANVNAEDDAIYQYTGGTTGVSKGACLTHGNLMSNLTQINSRDDTTSIGDGDDGVALVVLPLYHVFALMFATLQLIYHGGHALLLPQPRPIDNLRPAFEKFNVMYFPGVNTLYQALLQADWFRNNPPKNLKLCLSGAAPLQPAVAEEWLELTGCSIYEGYGLTESTCVVSSMKYDEPPRPGSCGKPLPGTQLRFVDDDGADVAKGERGEIWVKGPQIMAGYLNRPEATADAIEGGWFKTGDIGLLDDEGFLYIVDRKKDTVIVSGFNVFPTDIETVIIEMAGVAEVGVIGLPDAKSGERVVAYVVKADKSISEDDIISYCHTRLTNYKVPREVRFIAELPKSPVGKVWKSVV